jgi:CRP-like cAMP-binding protein
MNPGQILHQPGDRLKSAYFINCGEISILSVLPNRKSVAVAIVGKQGFIGLPLLAGFRSASTRAVVTVEASVLRISVDVLLPLLELRQALFRLLTRFSQILAMEIAQLSGCNRFHDGQDRLARYLLMSADRTGHTSCR